MIAFVSIPTFDEPRHACVQTSLLLSRLQPPRQFGMLKYFPKCQTGVSAIFLLVVNLITTLIGCVCRTSEQENGLFSCSSRMASEALTTSIERLFIEKTLLQQPNEPSESHRWIPEVDPSSPTVLCCMYHAVHILVYLCGATKFA